MPNITLMPLSVRRWAQLILAASSKRAASSTTASTRLPFVHGIHQCVDDARIPRNPVQADLYRSPAGPAPAVLSRSTIGKG